MITEANADEIQEEALTIPVPWPPRWSWAVVRWTMRRGLSGLGCWL